VIGSTSVVILLTVLILGGLTNPLIQLLNIPTTNKYSALQDDTQQQKEGNPHTNHRSDGHFTDKRFQDFETVYLYPMFIRSYSSNHPYHHEKKRSLSTDRLSMIPSEQSSYKCEHTPLHNFNQSTTSGVNNHQHLLEPGLHRVHLNHQSEETQEGEGEGEEGKHELDLEGNYLGEIGVDVDIGEQQLYEESSGGGKSRLHYALYFNKHMIDRVIPLQDLSMIFQKNG
jgi:hypothetical protein